ncbi:hypothetical protein BJ875DRAFT_152939 [Amylocarpus encephaloides]|uniref:NmrA-like domain-containing protein n=1 Tax=Amylocarpus encephaloides TaxID=45428 RepID=A0A9P8C8K2_9HELO|nr:hypothetical protein BJ875DRAFT_152939 [Amylocarpus encephaloides]
MPSTFLVTSASSTQGTSTVRHLLSSTPAPKVHALVRDTTSPIAKSLSEAGATLFQGEIDQLPSLRPAFTGVEGVFLNPTSCSQATTLITLAQSLPRVKTIILVTAFYTSAHPIWRSYDPTSGLYRYYNDKFKLEELVREAQFPNLTIMRPSWLMQTYALPMSITWFPELMRGGELAHYQDEDTRIPHIDAEDVGRFAARALLFPVKFRNEEIELAGENLSVRMVADVMGRATGRIVSTRQRGEKETMRVEERVPGVKLERLAEESNLCIDVDDLENRFGIRPKNFEVFCEREEEKLRRAIGRRPQGIDLRELGKRLNELEEGRVEVEEVGIV